MNAESRTRGVKYIERVTVELRTVELRYAVLSAGNQDAKGAKARTYSAKYEERSFTPFPSCLRASRMTRKAGLPGGNQDVPVDETGIPRTYKKRESAHVLSEIQREILHSVPFDYAPFDYAQGKQGKQDDTGGRSLRGSLRGSLRTSGSTG